MRHWSVSDRYQNAAIVDTCDFDLTYFAMVLNIKVRTVNSSKTGIDFNLISRNFQTWKNFDIILWDTFSKLVFDCNVWLFNKRLQGIFHTWY